MAHGVWGDARRAGNEGTVELEAVFYTPALDWVSSFPVTKPSAYMQQPHLPTSNVLGIDLESSLAPNSPTYKIAQNAQNRRI